MRYPIRMTQPNDSTALALPDLVALPAGLRESALRVARYKLFASILRAQAPRQAVKAILGPKGDRTHRIRELEAAIASLEGAHEELRRPEIQQQAIECARRTPDLATR